ncbi:hypothetical protein CDL15_Pgr020660 [Punica granatum]|uniref:Uncharacterized protein n=1 Tax=Punica granatum TaxID=22663 RepID=A0A218VT50_PUNGR|nr:hypothetical protein CDL15_Pgr020660 [Punica granatum]PKI67530.1 hypothetical protein CRG98_012114 [Punica granatum]
MAAEIAEFMAMFRGQNRASSNVTPPPGHRLTADLNPWVPPTFALESEGAPALTMTHALAVHPVNDPLPPSPAPTAVPLPPPAFLSTDSAMHTLPPLSMLVPPPVYIIPQPMVLPMTSAYAHALTVEPFPFPALQPLISFSYQAPPPLNIPPLELSTRTRQPLQLH